MVEFTVTEIKTIKAFFVDGNGIRKYCDTAIKTLCPDAIDLVTSNKYCVEHTWRLVSTDGFHYKAAISVGDNRYSLLLNLFSRDNFVLLYGGWERPEASAEMVIEGRICDVTLQQESNE